MKISICIPQYNRIDFLVKNLKNLENQTYDNIEVVISDDCSTDNTKAMITKISSQYKYPLTYFKQQQNCGYDANLRKSMELATGDYCFILGNDDTLTNEQDIEKLVAFLKGNNLPEVGFCNFSEEENLKQINERAQETTVIGSGPEIALKYCKSFSFVAGLIFKKSSFDIINTNKLDKSIYVQIYFGTLIIAKGGRLFTIADSMVIKDIKVGGERANSYRDTLFKTWREFKPIDSGLPQVAFVVVEAFKDANEYSQKIGFAILKKIYAHTYPFWLLDFRKNNSLLSSIALFIGLKPKAFSFIPLNFFYQAKVYIQYFISTIIGLFTPVFLFDFLRLTIYKFIKR